MIHSRCVYSTIGKFFLNKKNLGQIQNDIFRSLREEFLLHAVIYVMLSVYTNISLTYVICCEIILLYFPLNYVIEQKLMGTLSSPGLFEL